MSSSKSSSAGSSHSPVPSPAPVVSPGMVDDSISVNRQLPLVDASAIPAVSSAFRPTEVKQRRARLKRIANEHVAEGKEALQEIIDLKGAAKSDLGKHAPSVEESSATLSRLKNIQAVRSKVASLDAYLAEIEDIAISDMATLLATAGDLYGANVKHDASLATTYEKLATYLALPGIAVKQGIARKKELKEATKTAAAISGSASSATTGK